MFSFFKKFFSSKIIAKQDFKLQEIYDYLQMEPITSEVNYIRALTHSSYTKKVEEKNERLEFLGDAVINFCVADVLYFRMEGKDEGTLTKARAAIVNRKNLNKVGTEIGIKKYLRHKLQEKQLEDSSDVIGNAFEALMGAYFLDYGMHDMEILIGRLLLKDFDTDNFHKNILDPKSYIIEWSQGCKKQLILEHQPMPPNATVFSVILKIDGVERATGSGKNKKEAEQQACMNAINLLELNT
mgnify:CR=1 FL=1